MPSNIFFILAAISFGLAAFKVSSPVVDFVALGYCLVTIGLWLA